MDMELILNAQTVKNGSPLLEEKCPMHVHSSHQGTEKPIFSPLNPGEDYVDPR
jgi:hypothetical protein